MTTDSSKNNAARNRRRGFVGVVVSDKADKTRVVNVQWLVRHPKYEKIVRRRSKFYVHDEGNVSHVGDKVEIMSTRPMSKLKRWRLVRVLKAAERVETEEGAVKSSEAAA